jgi:hypothetical protein
VANSDEQLLSILESLEQCEAGLRASGRDDTAHLVAVAILELRMRINGISEAELKALCDEMLPPEQQSPAHPRRRPLLRLVK